MQPPPLLLGAALLFWGWQTGFPLIGAILAALIEGARLMRHRWEVSDHDFNRLWNFTALVFIAAAVFAFTTNQGGAAFGRMIENPDMAATRVLGEANQRATASLLEWMPIIFFPFLLALVLNKRARMKLAVFSLIARRAKRKASPGSLAEAEVIPAWAYFGLSLVSASINTSTSPLFFVGTATLLAWALWTHRSGRFSMVVWIGSFLAAVALAYVSQQQLGNLRRFLDNYTPQWGPRGGGHRTNPWETSTAIGQIGRLKGSGTIVIRLESRDGTPAPSLLRTASYRYYQHETWTAKQRAGAVENTGFNAVLPEGRTGTWILLSTNAPHRVQIATYLEGGKDVLPLPSGCARLEQLPAVDVATNGLGVALAEGPGLVLFDAVYGSKGSIDSPPIAPDVQAVPEVEKPALDRVIKELGLSGQSTGRILRAINGLFQDKFEYTTWQQPRARAQTNSTALAEFLLRTRAGHCEYFATATVLLLRELGIPARYAVGWSVQEASGSGFVVRERHAHSWCLVYYDGQWHDFDTTPASWSAEENRRASLLQFLGDAWSRVKFEFMKIRWGQSNLRKYVWWIVGPMLLFLLYRLFRSKPERPSRALPISAARAPARMGLDSEFYWVETKLAEFGFVREPAETQGKFLDRALLDSRVAGLREVMTALLSAHYRLRFDPAGLASEERDQLRRQVRESLDHLSNVRKPPK
jgi:hypothetical protein